MPKGIRGSGPQETKIRDLRDGLEALVKVMETALSEKDSEIERLQTMDGLEGRLARLLVTDDAGQRFVLSEGSAANIAAITREWVKPRNQQSGSK